MSWKIRNKIIALILFLIAAITVYILIIEERKANSLINPEIFPAFRIIENNCLMYLEQTNVDKNEYERCIHVVSRMVEDHESAEGYYIFLQKLGFNLPPLRLTIPPGDIPRRQALNEHKRLLDEQNKILDAIENSKILSPTDESDVQGKTSWTEYIVDYAVFFGIIFYLTFKGGKIWVKNHQPIWKAYLYSIIAAWSYGFLWLYIFNPPLPPLEKIVILLAIILAVFGVLGVAITPKEKQGRLG